MHPTRSARTAEREFLDSLRGPAAALITPAAARATQRAIDESRPLRIPVADAIEVPFTELTERERDSFFAAFDDTQPAAWA